MFNSTFQLACPINQQMQNASLSDVSIKPAFKSIHHTEALATQMLRHYKGCTILSL